MVDGDSVNLLGEVISIDAPQRVVRLKVLNREGQEMLAGQEIDFIAEQLMKV